MKRKSTNYTGPNSAGWLSACESLFLARFRGRPCDICGHKGGMDEGGKMVRSCGHHLIFQSQSRAHKFSEENVIILCPWHHSQFNHECSPHSIVSTDAQYAFEVWVKENKPEQFAWWQEHKNDEFDKSSTCARDLYVELGGEVDSKSGKMSDMKPKNHLLNMARITRDHGGVLSKTEKDMLKSKGEL